MSCRFCYVLYQSGSKLSVFFFLFLVESKLTVEIYLFCSFYWFKVINIEVNITYN